MISEFGFRRYLICVTTPHKLADASIEGYIHAIRVLPVYMKHYASSSINLFSIKSFDELEKVKIFVNYNPDFKNNDEASHHLYSCGFKHFFAYATKELSAK